MIDRFKTDDLSGKQPTKPAHQGQHLRWLDCHWYVRAHRFWLIGTSKRAMLFEESGANLIRISLNKIGLLKDCAAL